MNTKMDALIYRGKNKISFEKVTIPTIKDNEVLMKIKSVGICGTDLHIYRGELDIKNGTIPGHEFSGIVEKIGKNVTRVKTEDRIVAEHVISCNVCSYCKIGKPNLCDNREIIGVHRQGAMAEYISVPEALVYKFSNKISFDEAALIEPLSIAVYAIQDTGTILGKRVAVIGQGPVGMFMNQVLTASGALVTGIDIRQHALDFSMKNKWIHHAINSKTQNIKKRMQQIGSPAGFDLVYEVVGIEQTAEMSFEIARRDGSVYLLGVFSSPAKINLMNIVRKELNVFGSWTCAFAFPTSIDLVERGKVNLKGLITHRYKAKDGAKAFKDSNSYSENRIKTIINF